MLRILIKLLPCICMFIALSGCYKHKENAQPTGVEKHRYSGMIYEHYEEGRIDEQTGTYTKIAWDSAYAGQGFVKIDYSVKEIRFVVVRSDTITEPLYYTSLFTFVPGKTSYNEWLSHGYSDYYEINSPDSLVHVSGVYVSPPGNSGFLSSKVEFKGRKVN